MFQYICILGLGSSPTVIRVGNQCATIRSAWVAFIEGTCGSAERLVRAANVISIG